MPVNSQKCRSLVQCFSNFSECDTLNHKPFFGPSENMNKEIKKNLDKDFTFISGFQTLCLHVKYKFRPGCKNLTKNRVAK